MGRPNDRVDGSAFCHVETMQKWWGYHFPCRENAEKIASMMKYVHMYQTSVGQIDSIEDPEQWVEAST